MNVTLKFKGANDSIVSLEKDLVSGKIFPSPTRSAPVMPECKPPLGLRPEFIVLELRQKEIQEAVTRYMEAGKEIPKEWTAEYYRNSYRLLENYGED